jgi:hypothetical protein
MCYAVVFPSYVFPFLIQHVFVILFYFDHFIA